MIYNLRRIKERDMLRNWAISEVASVRRQKYLTEILPPDLLQKIQRGQYKLAESEWQELEKMIRSTRAQLLDGLMSLELIWHEGEFQVDEVKDLRMMNWPPFVTLAGSRNFIDLVQTFRQGKMPQNHHEFAANLRRIRSNFALEEMNGRPIVVSQSERPPYLLVEGFTRLSAIMLNVLDGKSYGDAIPVILGIGERLNEWSFV